MKNFLLLLILLFILNSLATTGMMLCIAPNNHIEFEVAESNNSLDKHESPSCDASCSNEPCDDCFDITLPNMSNTIIRQQQITVFQQFSDTLPLFLANINLSKTYPSKTSFSMLSLFSQSAAQKAITTTILLI